jgi:hypothetical protein
MPSTYTLNNGIELIGTGEQSGTWGDTTNTNFELIDTALDGQVTVTLASAGTSGSPNNLPVSDGATSDGRNRLVIFNDGGDLGATAYVQLTPNDAEKIIYVRNDLSGSQSIILFQGTYNASNDYEVPAGTTAVIYFDGAGSGAVAANVFNNAYFDSLRLGDVSVTAILDEDDMTSDSATALATQQSIKAYVDTQVGANNELSEVLANGNTSGGTNIQMSTTDELQFRDTAIKISSSTDGKMDIDADLEVEIVAPTVDIDASTAMTIDTASLEITGAVDMNTSLNVDGDITGDGLTIAGNVSVDGGTIKLDGNLPGGTDNVALGDTAGDALTTGGINNTAVGSAALSAATTQDANTAVGYNALNLAESSNNTAVGSGSGALLTTGPSNTAVGQDALNEAVSAGYNTAVGAGAGDVLGDEVVATALVSGVNYTIQSLGTTDFTLVGAGSNTVGTSFTATGAGTGTGTASANANYNTLLGHQSGNLIVGGSKNTVLGRFSGNQGGLDIRNSDNNIVLSDGDGNPRLSIDSSGDMNVTGTVTADGLVLSDGGDRTITGPLNNDLIINSRGNTSGEGTKIQSSGVDRLLVDDTTGDISFYEDTGTTAKFFWDASAESLGIGTSSPVFSTGGGVEVSHASSANLRLNSDLGGAAEIRHGTDLTIETRSAEPVIIGTNSTERVRIDSSGNVGIGTAPSNRLSLGKGISYNADSALYSDVGVNDSAVNNNAVYNWRTGITGNASGHSYTFSTLARTQGSYVERARLDASGNLLVGTTSITPGIGNTTTGVRVGGGGVILASINNSDAATFNRNSSDGDIAVFRKDGTTVGSIGSVGGVDLSIGTDTTGLRFYDGSNADGGVGIIVPWNTSTNAPRDAQMNLGSGTERYRNLYLSGGAYIRGGTTGESEGNTYWAIRRHNDGGGGLVFPTLFANKAQMGELYAYDTSNGNWCHYSLKKDDQGSTIQIQQISGTGLTIAATNSGGTIAMSSTASSVKIVVTVYQVEV